MIGSGNSRFAVPAQAYLRVSRKSWINRGRDNFVALVSHLLFELFACPGPRTYLDMVRNKSSSRFESVVILKFDSWTSTELIHYVLPFRFEYAPEDAHKVQMLPCSMDSHAIATMVC